MVSHKEFVFCLIPIIVFLNLQYQLSLRKHNFTASEEDILWCTFILHCSKDLHWMTFHLWLYSRSCAGLQRSLVEFRQIFKWCLCLFLWLQDYQKVSMSFSVFLRDLRLSSEWSFTNGSQRLYEISTQAANSWRPIHNLNLPPHPSPCLKKGYVGVNISLTALK